MFLSPLDLIKIIIEFTHIEFLLGIGIPLWQTELRHSSWFCLPFSFLYQESEALVGGLKLSAKARSLAA